MVCDRQNKTKYSGDEAQFKWSLISLKYKLASAALMELHGEWDYSVAVTSY